MGKLYEEITQSLRDWIEQQHLFFVASAPLSSDGHVNCSPKGLDTFRILGPRQVAYLDLTGSGAETVAHVRENGRIVFMFCAFSGKPLIVRLHGTSRVVLQDDEQWSELNAHFPDIPGSRAVIVADITRISDSCGYGIPKYDCNGEGTLERWAINKGERLPAYRVKKNARSIDGLPAIEPEH